MFPADEYTPHGYLDNPAHAWKLPGPGGVLRSCPAIGMGWHFPSLAANYNRKKQYVCNLRIGFRLADGTLLLDNADFSKAGVKLFTSYRSKNMLRFEAHHLPGGLKAIGEFFLADHDSGNGLVAIATLSNHGPTAQKISLLAILDYERNLGEGLTWESGMYARAYDKNFPTSQQIELYAAHTIGTYQEGTQFHLALASFMAPGQAEVKVSSVAGISDAEGLKAALAGKAITPAGMTANHLTGFSELAFEINPNQALAFGLGLGRGESEKQAVEACLPYLDKRGNVAAFIQSRHFLADRDFWANAPRFSGDWPAHLRRGLVYDFESLRAIVRRPAGIYKNRWDAMQLQVPRVVLAEAALDMLLLSYADPQAAKEVLYGTFADSPEPNIPCSREDGSYNMIAADGSPCGTAPEWCFPFHCIELVYRLTGDKEWLGRLFPYLENYIGFWLVNRLDEQGRPYYKCSWEAGQDNSPRFGIKDDPSGGGALTEHIWPVDLHAALAQSCRLLAEWGRDLGLDTSTWAGLSEKLAEGTRRMFHNGWFHDYDRQTATFTAVLDTMQLAPLLCGVASAEQVAAVQSHLENPPKHGQIFHPLMWPSVAFCLIEACNESGRQDLAAAYSWDIINPVYRWLDSSPVDIDPEKGGLPGVGREYWPQVLSPDQKPPRGGGGAEVYGWGCLPAYLALRYIAGFAPQKNGFTLTPGLPPALLEPGKVYRVGPLLYHNMQVDITYEVAQDLLTTVTIKSPNPVELKVLNGNGTELFHAPPQTEVYCQFNISNGESLAFLV